VPPRTALTPALKGALALTPVLAAGAVAATACYARHVAPYRPVLERVNIRVPATALELVGTRIGFVTDTHLGPAMSRADIERALRLLVDARPDLILFGGDYLCESPRSIPDAAAVLAEAARAAPHGGIAVLGNHDYSNGADRVAACLERSGIRVLRNAAAPVPLARECLWVVGIDDAILGRPNPEAAFRDVPADAPAIALWHEPDWAEQTAERGALLQLSGHSHGGQVRFPRLGPIAAPSGGRRFVAGIHHAAGMPVYTARGVGVYRPPVRFRCPPEVTLITLIEGDGVIG
jgi:predicted MPP superfamily phosphohydrolase